MSSRALGSLEESADHNKVRNMKLVAIDCVADPSYPKAFVNGILESKQWVLADNGQYEEAYKLAGRIKDKMKRMRQAGLQRSGIYSIRKKRW